MHSHGTQDTLHDIPLHHSIGTTYHQPEHFELLALHFKGLLVNFLWNHIFLDYINFILSHMHKIILSKTSGILLTPPSDAINSIRRWCQKDTSWMSSYLMVLEVSLFTNFIQNSPSYVSKATMENHVTSNQQQWSIPLKNSWFSLDFFRYVRLNWSDLHWA